MASHMYGLRIYDMDRSIYTTHEKKLTYKKPIMYEYYERDINEFFKMVRIKLGIYTSGIMEGKKIFSYTRDNPMIIVKLNDTMHNGQLCNKYVSIEGLFDKYDNWVISIYLGDDTILHSLRLSKDKLYKDFIYDEDPDYPKKQFISLFTKEEKLAGFIDKLKEKWINDIKYYNDDVRDY